MAGKSIGNLFVTISAKTKKFGESITAAEKRSKRFKSAITATTKAVGIAFVAMGATAAFGLKKVIDAAVEQEAVEKRLAAVIESTGMAAEFTSQEMVDMAAAMQKVTTVGDEVIIAGQAVLATFKSIRGEGFERATKAALDMSEVMQTDLQSSIVMIGKALNDPIANLSAMSRAGVQFTKVQKDMVKELWQAGRAADAQNIILKELESQFGGAAEAARDTFGGSAKAAKNAFGDLQENIGFAITKNEIFIELVKSTEERFFAWGEAVKESGGKFDNAFKNMLIGMETVEISWMQIQLAGQTALITLADGMLIVEKSLRASFWLPMSKVFDLLVKLGQIDVNPFDSIEAGLSTFSESAEDVDNDIRASILATEIRYIKWLSKIGQVEEATKKLGKTAVDSSSELLTIEEQTFKERSKLQGEFSDLLFESRNEGFEHELMLLNRRKEEFLSAGIEEQAINEALAERYKEIQEEKTLASSDFMAGVTVGLEQLAENARTIAEVGAETTTMLFNSVTRGIGQSVAGAIVEGESLGKALEAVMKNVAKNIIANLITIGVQRVILGLLNQATTLNEHVTRTAALASETYAGAFAATAAIPIIGPILAPGVAATSLATMLTGQAAASGAGAAAGASIAHGGLDSVPREQTFLLDKGERVLSPTQNQDLTEFLANGGGGQNVTFNITAFDSDTMVTTVRETIIPMLQDALELNSENFRDSVQLAVA